MVRFRGGADTQYSSKRFGSLGISAHRYRTERDVTSVVRTFNKITSRASKMFDNCCGHSRSILLPSAINAASNGCVITLASMRAGSSLIERIPRDRKVRIALTKVTALLPKVAARRGLARNNPAARLLVGQRQDEDCTVLAPLRARTSSDVSPKSGGVCTPRMPR